LVLPMFKDLGERYGWEVAAAAVEYVLKTRRGRDPFPTVYELETTIKTLLGGTAETGSEVAGRILQSVTKFGSPNVAEAEKYIGPVGWEVVKLFGGWSSICQNMKVDQKTIYFSQWKSLAEDLLKKAEVQKIAGTLSGGVSRQAGFYLAGRGASLPVEAEE
jgi:hypothetical protein